MKKLLFGLILGISFTALVGAGVESYQANKQTAEISKRLGISVCTDCTPVLEYDKIGEVVLHTYWSRDYGTIRDALVKKARKDYPNCDGILCYPENNGLTAVRADVIKFK
jgi:hypothetical protein